MAESRVWITRTLPEARSTAERVMALGCEAVIEPVLEVRRLATDWPDAPFDALILTSAHALKALIEDGPFGAYCDTALLVVGDSLKIKATEAGFRGPVTAFADARALSDALTGHLPPKARLWLITPRDPAAPLEDWLTAKGFGVTRSVVYETVPIHAAIPQPGPDGRLFVLLHSPRAAQQTGALIRAAANTNVSDTQDAPRFRLDVLTFICISEAARRALEIGLGTGDDKGVCSRVAARPDEAGLIECLIACMQ